MFEQLAKRIEEHPEETDAYAVLLWFKLGLRIGEVVALKWSDIDWQVHDIRRTVASELYNQGVSLEIIRVLTSNKTEKPQNHHIY